MSQAAQSSRQIWGFRIGRILQLLGLVIGLEGLLVYGSEPKEGPMIYVTTAAVAVFYLGWFLARKFTPAQHKKK
jgi:hypothetical protein